MSVRLHRVARRRDLAALHAARSDRYPCLLESAVQGTPRARYDILFASAGEHLALEADGTLTGRRCRRPGFLANLDEWWSDLATREDGPAPFFGGWFLFLGYELVGEIEPTLELPPADRNLPIALAIRCPVAVVWDHEADEGWVVAEAGAEALARTVHADVTDLGLERGDGSPVAAPTPVVDAPERYAAALEQIHEYILAGDVFQVNLSRAWHVPGSFDPAAVYRALRTANPAPFGGSVRWGDSAVVSSSPERLVAVRDHWAETRPIAGTRPRGDGETQDRALRDELIENVKERAEHIMLIDLERNDLGRVCEPGTVEVDELMVVESYAHVHHIVSNVRGRLRPGMRPGQVIRATFPGGTITGCPKVRCMEIVAELEKTARGAYTGSFGYLNRDGSMDLNILIRTLTVTPEGIGFRAGAGIVADSRFDRELPETEAKARGLLAALGAL
ncbi:MAG: aminodeoxychorismate synthase component I [Pseudomonadota bacterium]